MKTTPSSGCVWWWKLRRGLECKSRKSRDILGVTGKFGLGVQNEAGQRLTVLPREHSGHSKHPLPKCKRWLYTWTSPDGQYRKQIDYILCSWRWRSSIQSVKSRLGADWGSDHELLIANFRLNLKSRENH